MLRSTKLTVGSAKVTAVVPSVDAPLIHWALYYNDAAEYVDGVTPFIRAGLTANEPTLAFVPHSNVELLRAALGSTGEQVMFLDAEDFARNPARIVGAAREFAASHTGGRIRIVGEPIWAGRSATEIEEGVRHEASVNVLFADIAATVLCPYDAAGLGAAVLADAKRTHPHVLNDGQYDVSPWYVDPTVVLSLADRLQAAPADAHRLDISEGELSAVRLFVAAHASRMGLVGARLLDLLVAVNEVATNTLAYSPTSGILRMWRSANAVVCEVVDAGRVSDPWVGRLITGPHAVGGRGLYLANQLCDLVQIRSGEWGTAVRLHVTIDPQDETPPSTVSADSLKRAQADFDAVIARAGEQLPTPDLLCSACVEVLQVDGAAISLVFDGVMQGTFGSAGELIARLDEWQFTFGEGPCIEAVAQGLPVLVPDLLGELEDRWLAFAEVAVDAGVRAVFAFPLEIAGSLVGALTLYRLTPGPLTQDGRAAATVAASHATSVLEDLVRVVADGAIEPDGYGNWPAFGSWVPSEVYQATGMVMRQLGVGAPEALVRLRAHAFANDKTAIEVARAIVERRLLIPPD